VFEPRRGHKFLSIVSVLCCQVEVSGTGRFLVRKSLSECGVSEYDLETLTETRPRPTRAVEPGKKAHNH